jgi:putative ABC transport system substrate-binding protein
MQMRRASLVLAGLVLAWAAAMHAHGSPPGPMRVAYLTTFAPREAQARIDAVAARIEARWPAAARPPGATITYRVFAFESPLTGSRMDAAQRRQAEQRMAATNGKTIAAMLAWKPNVIFAPGALAAREAARHTTSVPIVFGCKCNPLADGWGLVKDPARPERNLTGFTRYHLGMLGGDREQRLNLQRKRIELLQLASAAPVRRIGAIHGDEYDEGKWRYVESARALGVEWVRVRLDEGSIEQLPDRVREEKLDAAIVLADDFAEVFRGRLIEAAARTPVPVMFPWDEADAGGWMHYGTVVDVNDKAAEYLVNILQGRRVAQYPVEFPKKMELVVNLRTARANGWEYPRGFLRLVDRAVE